MPEALFNALCVYALLAKAYNYRLQARRLVIHKYLVLSILTSFLITETYVALLPGTPWGYWAYVALCVWGIYSYWGMRND
jgi:hypothetical protein